MFLEESFNLVSHIRAGLRVHIQAHSDDFWMNVRRVLADYYAFPNLDEAIKVQREPPVSPTGGCGYRCLLSTYQY